MTNNDFTTPINFNKICAFAVGIYIICVTVLYFAAGEQFFIRNSLDNIDNIKSETPAAQMLAGDIISQSFTANMDTLKTVGVKFACFARENSGRVEVKITNSTSNQVLASQIFDISTIKDGEYTYVTALENQGGICGDTLTLTITCLSGEDGSSIAPWLSLSQKRDGWTLSYSKFPLDGTLTFLATGEDFVWTGPRYWYMAAGGLGFLLLFIAYILSSVKKGRHNIFVNAIIAFVKYRFLLSQLIIRDFKVKYKRSVLGVFWSFLNPLLTMMVQYIVFSALFRSDIPNYPVYLLTAIIFFSLITKVYIPKYIYPTARVLSSTINLLISMIPLLIVILLTGTHVTKAYILMVFPVVCMVIFCLGMAFILSSLMVFFRDIYFLWGVVTMIWMYSTPIFYPISINPDQFLPFMKLNPLYQIITFARTIIIEGISPDPRSYLMCAFISLATFAVGAVLFKKTQDKFIFYI